MVGRELFLRLLLAALATVASLAFALVPAHATGFDPANMSGDEINALEQRLTDAGCYKGEIDGQASEALFAAIAACPDQRPFLRIETGMHAARIRRIGVDGACALLATASDDKTVRLWSLPAGKLKRVVRLPIGQGNAGKIFATALSSDGRFLAIGGWDAAWDSTGKSTITVIDLSSGAIRRFGAFEDVVDDLAISADGSRLAVGLAGNNGVRVLDSRTGKELLADRDYGDSVYGLAFAPDGGLVASSYDGNLRRYGFDLRLVVKRPAPDGKLPYGVGLDLAGRRVAVGYADTTAVSIVDAKTLSPLAKAQTSDLTKGDLSRVAWSRDGATLLSGGQQLEDEWRRVLRRFDGAGRRLGADDTASGGAIFDIVSCGDGFAFSAADPSFGLVSAQGVATTLQGPRNADMRRKLGPASAVSPDAASVRFGLDTGEKRPLVFDLATAR